MKTRRKNTNRIDVWSIPEQTRFWFTAIFLATSIVSHATLWSLDTYTFSIELALDYIAKAGVASVVATFTIIEGGDFLFWLYEDIKQRHLKVGREERDRVFKEWYEKEKDAGTLGTPEQSPPPFLDRADSDSVR